MEKFIPNSYVLNSYLYSQKSYFHKFKWVKNTPHGSHSVAERRNRTIGERIQALLHASGLPKFLWGEAARHVVWLLNRTSTKAVEGMTPFEAAFGNKPDLKSVREWGEKVFVRIEGGTKLGGRVCEGRWLGIDNESKGARVYWLDTKMVTIKRNIYYDNSSVSHLEEEQEPVGLTKTVAKDVPLNLLATQNQEDPGDSAVDSDVDTTAKCMRKPSKKVMDLLKGGKGVLAPGICYDFKRFRQLLTVVGSKVRGQMSLEECKS